MDEIIDPEKFRLFQTKTPYSTKMKNRWIYQPEKGEHFLRGPIPKWWINLAAGLPGRASQVGQELWFLAGVTLSSQIKFNQSSLAKIGISRDSVRRGLRALETAGLVSVVRKEGRGPLVTIILEKPSGYKINGNGKESRMKGEK